MTTFPPHSPLRADLLARVEEYFRSTGRGRHGGWSIVGKSAILGVWLAASYVLLVFYASSWWDAALLATSLGLAAAGIGFNVQHDGGHGAYAATATGNRLAALALDLVGGSSYVWRFKHSVIHHTWTNLDGIDDDIDAGPFLRLAPTQERRRYHRLQHWYVWLLFGFLPPKWTFYDDFKAVAEGRIGSRPMPRPRGLDLALFVAGKIAFAGLVFGLPLAVGHGVLAVLFGYGVYALVTGICISLVFQLAHCVEGTDFPSVRAEPVRTARPFFEHQLATTADFSPRNRLLTWYVGGLNFQVEHHLLPQVSHVHYPALAPIVRATCAEHGVPHLTHERFLGALRSHVRHLRRLGKPAETTVTAGA